MISKRKKNQDIIVKTVQLKINNPSKNLQNFLYQASRETNQVWNYCNRLSYEGIKYQSGNGKSLVYKNKKKIKENKDKSEINKSEIKNKDKNKEIIPFQYKSKRYLSDFNLIKLTSGSTFHRNKNPDGLRFINQANIQEICKEFATRRIQSKVAKLSYRSNHPDKPRSKRSPNWIPFKQENCSILLDDIRVAGKGSTPCFNAESFVEYYQENLGDINNSKNSNKSIKCTNTNKSIKCTNTNVNKNCASHNKQENTNNQSKAFFDIRPSNLTYTQKCNILNNHPLIPTWDRSFKRKEHLLSHLAWSQHRKRKPTKKNFSKQTRKQLNKNKKNQKTIKYNLQKEHNQMSLNRCVIKVMGHLIPVHNMGWLVYHLEYLGAVVKSGSFSQDKTGNWYLNFSVAIDKTLYREKHLHDYSNINPIGVHEIIGIDPGIKTSGVLSPGVSLLPTIDKNKIKQQQTILRNLQRNKKYKQYARLHRKIKHQKQDSVNKIALFIINQGQTIKWGSWLEKQSNKPKKGTTNKNKKDSDNNNQENSVNHVVYGINKSINKQENLKNKSITKKIQEITTNNNNSNNSSSKLKKNPKSSTTISHKDIRRIRYLHKQIKQYKHHISLGKPERNHLTKKQYIACFKELKQLKIKHNLSIKKKKRKPYKELLQSRLNGIRTHVSQIGQWAGRCVDDVNEAYTTQACIHCDALTGPYGYKGLAMRQWVCSSCKGLNYRDWTSACHIQRVPFQGGLKELLKPRTTHVVPRCLASNRKKVVSENKAGIVSSLHSYEKYMC